MTIQEFQPRWMLRNSIDYINEYNRPKSVFKYLDQEHIDHFFSEGILKLGTFNEFKSIEDIARSDKQEGTHEYLIWNKNRTHFRTLRRFTGVQNLIFCTSATNNFNLLSSKFNVSGYFEIANPLGFAYELSKVINGFVKGMEGPAIYTGSGQTNFFTDMYKVPDFNEETPMHEIFHTADVISKINFDLYFSKSITPHSIENEYRFVWLLDHIPNQDENFIKCPGAIKYCRKLT